MDFIYVRLYVYYHGGLCEPHTWYCPLPPMSSHLLSLTGNNTDYQPVTGCGSCYRYRYNHRYIPHL